MTGHVGWTQFDPPGRWIRFRACAGMDPKIFFPGRGGLSHQHVRQAFACCARCPVRLDCLDYAMRQGTLLSGIWGGTTQHWRNQARNRAIWRAGRTADADVG